MKENWLQFLFGESAIQQELETDADDLKRLFETADSYEQQQLKFNKTSLTDALKAIGVELGEGLELDTEGYTLTVDDRDVYAEITRKLSDVDNMHRLAVAGWVAERCGDQAMANEPAEFKLRFLDITEVSATDKDAPVHTEDSTDPDLGGVIKQSRENDTTAQKHDDKLNPVENPDDEMGERTTGVGKATDGSEPEGKPKGSTSKTESLAEGRHKAGCTCGFCKNMGRFGKKQDAAEPKSDAADEQKDAVADNLSAQELADKLLEMTGTGSMGTLEMGAPGLGLETKGSGGKKLGHKFRMPPQWKQKQPITKKRA